MTKSVCEGISVSGDETGLTIELDCSSNSITLTKETAVKLKNVITSILNVRTPHCMVSDGSWYSCRLCGIAAGSPKDDGFCPTPR